MMVLAVPAVVGTRECVVLVRRGGLHAHRLTGADLRDGLGGVVREAVGAGGGDPERRLRPLVEIGDRYFRCVNESGVVLVAMCEDVPRGVEPLSGVVGEGLERDVGRVRVLAEATVFLGEMECAAPLARHVHHDDVAVGDLVLEVLGIVEHRRVGAGHGSAPFG